MGGGGGCRQTYFICPTTCEDRIPRDCELGVVIIYDH